MKSCGREIVNDVFSYVITSEVLLFIIVVVGGNDLVVLLHHKRRCSFASRLA